MKKKIKKLLEKFMELVNGAGAPALVGLLIALQIAPPMVLAAVQPDRLTQKPRAQIGAGVAQDSDLNFDVGLGASNPRLRYKVSDQSLELNKGILRFGSGTAADQILEADKGSGATNPKLRFNNTSSKWEFSNNGTTYSGVGSGGGGGGGGVNLLTGDDNPGFEDGTSVWTASGGSFTAISSGQAYGTNSARFNASALNQTLTSASKAIPSGLFGASCLALISYKYVTGSNGDYKLQVTDGTNVLGEISIELSSDYRNAFVGFQCPSSGSVNVRVIAAVADPGDIDFDGGSLSAGNVHLGSNIMLANISSAEFYGRAVWPGTASCAWNVTGANNTWTSFGADADCTFPAGGNLVGKASAPGTKIPAIQLINAPPGEYFVVAQFYVSNGASSTVRLFDGTTGAPPKAFGDVSSTGDGLVTGHFSYTTSGTRTIELQASGRGSAATINVNNTIPGFEDLSFTVYRYPTVAETALIGTDTSGYFVQAQIYATDNSNISLGTSTISTFQEITSSVLTLETTSGSSSAQIACSTTNPSTGATCAAGNEGIGLAFNIPKAGAHLVCAKYSWEHGGSGVDGPMFKLVETPNNAQTVLQDGTVMTSRCFNNGSCPGSADNCSVFNFTSAGQKTIRLFYIQDANAALSSSLLYTNSTGAETVNGPQKVQFKVIPLNQQFPMPTIVNMVTSGANSAERVFRVRMSQCTSDPCPIIDQGGGSWLSSISYLGTGDYRLNILAGIFSSTPTCVVQKRGQNGTTANQKIWQKSLTATDVRVRATASDGSTGQDSAEGFEMICMGPR